MLSCLALLPAVGAKGFFPFLIPKSSTSGTDLWNQGSRASAFTVFLPIL